MKYRTEIPASPPSHVESLAARIAANCVYAVFILTPLAGMAIALHPALPFGL